MDTAHFTVAGFTLYCIVLYSAFVLSPLVSFCFLRKITPAKNHVSMKLSLFPLCNHETLVLLLNNRIATGRLWATPTFKKYLMKVFLFSWRDHCRSLMAKSIGKKITLIREILVSPTSDTEKTGNNLLSSNSNGDLQPG